MKQNGQIKALFAASIGNALEWYDFGLYGYLALTMQELFFPFENATYGLLSVFSIFALGLFMRPLGGLIFGHIGDKIGRKTALIASIATMAVPTFMMGFIPTYAQAGIVAIILLLTIRLLQGLAVGGEMIGAMVFLAEHAPPDKRGLACSLTYSIGSFGGLLGASSGAFITTFFSQEEILAWAWRLPFFLGLVVGGVGLYIRLKISETPLFINLSKAHKTAKHPLKEALKDHPREILITFFLISFQAVGFYLPFVYLTTWLTKEAGFSRGSSLTLNTLAMLALVLFIPVFASLSDRIGRRKVLMAGALATCVLSIPLFSLFLKTEAHPHPFALALGAMSIFALLTAIYQGPLPATLAELLNTKNRYMSLVIGYNCSAALFGGITPLLSIYLIEKTGMKGAPSILLVITGATAFLVLLTKVKETYNIQLK